MRGRRGSCCSALFHGAHELELEDSKIECDRPLLIFNQQRSDKNIATEVSPTGERAPHPRPSPAALPRERGATTTYSFLTACPPNSLRSDDSSLSVNESSSRERKRSISDSVITGAETLRSSAASTVQRPSPESTT